MRFQFAALIAAPEVLAAVGGVRAVTPIRLDDALALVPVSRLLIAGRYGVPSSPVEPGFRHLERGFLPRVLAASALGVVAYVEADFVDTIGAQSAQAWHWGEVVFGPEHVSHTGPAGVSVPPISSWPINKVLRFLGVRTARGLDEFDTLRLGRHTRIENWLDVDAKPRREFRASA